METVSPANVTRQTKPDETQKQRRRLCSHRKNPENTDTMNTNNNDSPFGDVIYTYTRAHAVADGFQVEVTKTAQEAGIHFPVFLSRRNSFQMLRKAPEACFWTSLAETVGEFIGFRKFS
jgi:predicted pyridoxine 5'-phosphate oxidase superfamily flavin-nucleotide-binding protein